MSLLSKFMRFEFGRLDDGVVDYEFRQEQEYVYLATLVGGVAVEFSIIEESGYDYWNGGSCAVGFSTEGVAVKSHFRKFTKGTGFIGDNKTWYPMSAIISIEFVKKIDGETRIHE